MVTRRNPRICSKGLEIGCEPDLLLVTGLVTCLSLFNWEPSIVFVWSQYDGGNIICNHVITFSIVLTSELISYPEAEIVEKTLVFPTLRCILVVFV